MTKLARPVQGETYRRPNRDRPYRVVWFDEKRGKDRRAAFAWIGPALREAERVGGLIVNLKTDQVTRPYDHLRGEVSNAYGFREPTPEETERILALKLTYEARGDA